jgi:hypothetical protein
VDDLLESYSGRAAELTSDLARAVGKTLGALLGVDGAPNGAPDGAPDGAPKSVEEMIERVANVVGGNLTQALGALLGGGGAPDPADSRVAQPVAFLPYERTPGLFERVSELVGRMVQTADGALGGGLPKQTGEPGAPPVAPLPVVPVAPGGPAPVGSAFFGAAGSSADAFQLLFAILVLFSVALLQGGKPSWRCREPLRPSSALRLAVERPG